MKKIVSLGVFFLLISIAQIVYGAGNVSLSSNKSSVKVGEEFSVSVSISNMSVASLTARVGVDTSKVDYVSGPSNSSFKNGRAIYTWTDPNGGESPKTSGVIATFKFKAKATGSCGFSVNGDFYTPEETSVNPIFSGTTVTIIEDTPIVPDPPSTPERPSTPETPSKPETSPEQGNQGTTTTPSQPSQGNNTSLSSNANLKSLRLDVEGLTPAFNKEIMQYNVVVNENVTDIDVLAVAEDGNSTVYINGNHGLQMGSNTIQIIVTAQNGNKKIYSISVTKTAEAELSNSLLENLAIENVTLNPEFRADVLEYSAQVGSTQENLNVLAIPQREAAKVNIEGNSNLPFGQSNVSILVTAENGITTTTYTVKVYRKTEEEERQEELNASLMMENDQSANNKNKNKLRNIVIIGIVVISAAIIGVLIMKYKKSTLSK